MALFITKFTDSGPAAAPIGDRVDHLLGFVGTQVAPEADDLRADPALDDSLVGPNPLGRYGAAPRSGVGRHGVVAQETEAPGDSLRDTASVAISSPVFVGEKQPQPRAGRRLLPNGL